MESDNEFSNVWNEAQSGGSSGDGSGIVETKDSADFFEMSEHISGSSSCPADLTFSLFGHGFNVYLGWFCQYLSVISLVLKSLAWIYVGRMVLGAF